MIIAKKRINRFKNSNNDKMFSLKKSLYLLPNFFTLSNAFFGFSSIIFAARLDFFSAAYFILLGALMDALDGRIARFLGASSEIGLQLDSLADAISFCLAPAIFIYFWQLKSIGLIGLFVSSLFFLAGILRLARFNVTTSQQKIFFLGLPTTIAGCFLAILFLNTNFKYENNFLLPLVLIISLILSFLMMSRVRFPAFKQKLFNLSKNRHKVFLIIFLAFVFIMQLHRALFLLFLFYFSSAIFLPFRFKNI